MARGTPATLTLTQPVSIMAHFDKSSNGVADFTVVKAGRTSLISCKRWKAASHGLEPLRELDAARRAQEANEAIYIAAGTVTDNARRFAAANRISLLEGPELTRLLRLAKSAAKKG